MALFDMIMNIMRYVSSSHGWLSEKHTFTVGNGFIPPSQRSKFSGVARQKRQAKKLRNKRK